MQEAYENPLEKKLVSYSPTAVSVPTLKIETYYSSFKKQI